MSLQFGRDKCEKMHIGKVKNGDICVDFKVDAWKDKVVSNSEGKSELEDIYLGKEIMKNVTDKKYLGDIVSDDLKIFFFLNQT